VVLGIQFLPVFFPGQSWFVGFKELFTDVPQISVRDAKFPNFFFKYGNYVNSYKNFDSSLVVENIYSSRTAIS